MQGILEEKSALENRAGPGNRAACLVSILIKITEFRRRDRITGRCDAAQIDFVETLLQTGRSYGANIATVAIRF
jgi:hypothetical protein